MEVGVEVGAGRMGQDERMCGVCSRHYTERQRREGKVMGDRDAAAESVAARHSWI